MLGVGCWVPSRPGFSAADPVGEGRAAAGDAGADRSRWDLEHGRDLGVVEADQVAERHRGALLGREDREGGVDVDAVRYGVVDSDRVGTRLGNDVDGSGAAGPPAGLVE